MINVCDDLFTYFVRMFGLWKTIPRPWNNFFFFLLEVQPPCLDAKQKLAKICWKVNLIFSEFFEDTETHSNR